MLRIVIPITKQEAATRQLSQAVRLFFADGDILSIHTLAAAGRQLVEDLGKKQKIGSIVRSEHLINPARRTEFLRALASTENFLKHADRDPDESHDYVEETTTFLLFEAVELAGRVLLWEAIERRAFVCWFAFSYPELFVDEFIAQLRESAGALNLDPTNRGVWRQVLGET